MQLNFDSTAQSFQYEIACGSGKTGFKRISDQLPPGAEAVVNFLFVEDREPFGSNASEKDPQTHHAATVKITKESTAMKAIIHVASYATGDYKENVDPQGRPSSEDLPIEDKSAGQALVILTEMKAIFQKAAALPADRKLHYSRATVMVLIPGQKIQLITLDQGVRGTADLKSVNSHWSTEEVKDIDLPSQNKRLDSLNKKFRNLVEQAGKRPAEVPGDAVRIKGYEIQYSRTIK